MNTLIVRFPLLTLIVVFTKLNFGSGEMRDYSLTTKLLNTIASSDPDIKDYLQYVDKNYLYGGQAVLKYLRNIKSEPILTKRRKTVNNLYSALKHFMDDNCLIVVNNFESVDLHPTTEYPLILRQFDIALGRAEYLEHNKLKTILNILGCQMLRFLN